MNFIAKGGSAGVGRLFDEPWWVIVIVVAIACLWVAFDHWRKRDR